MSVAAQFKGWTKPGPIPPGALGRGPEVEAGESLDAISGHFRLFQAVEGHRFSSDDVLTAWSGTQGCPSAGSVLASGRGIGPCPFKTYDAPAGLTRVDLLWYWSGKHNTTEANH